MLKADCLAATRNNSCRGAPQHFDVLEALFRRLQQARAFSEFGHEFARYSCLSEHFDISARSALQMLLDERAACARAAVQSQGRGLSEEGVRGAAVRLRGPAEPRRRFAGAPFVQRGEAVGVIGLE